MAPSFLFIQFEFTHAIGPHAGSYVIRDTAEAAAQRAAPADPSPRRSVNELLGVSGSPGSADVLVIAAVNAPTAPMAARRRPRRLRGAEAPEPVPLLRAAFVRATKPLDKRIAAEALDQYAHSESLRQGLIDDGLRALNRAIQAYRIVAADPAVGDVSARDSRRVRIGHGTIDELMHGEWQDAVELPQPRVTRKDRSAALRPAEAVAQALAGRLLVLEGEEVLLRALADVDAGRTRAAAFQVLAALALISDELGEVGYVAIPEGRSTSSATAWSERRSASEELAGAARERTLSAEEVERLVTVIDATLTALEAWRTGADPTALIAQMIAEDNAGMG